MNKPTSKVEVWWSPASLICLTPSAVKLGVIFFLYFVSPLNCSHVQYLWQKREREREREYLEKKRPVRITWKLFPASRFCFTLILYIGRRMQGIRARPDERLEEEEEVEEEGEGEDQGKLMVRRRERYQVLTTADLHVSNYRHTHWISIHKIFQTSQKGNHNFFLSLLFHFIWFLFLFIIINSAGCCLFVCCCGAFEYQQTSVGFLWKLHWNVDWRCCCCSVNRTRVMDDGFGGVITLRRGWLNQRWSDWWALSGGSQWNSWAQCPAAAL